MEEQGDQARVDLAGGGRSQPLIRRQVRGGRGQIQGGAIEERAVVTDVVGQELVEAFPRGSFQGRAGDGDGVVPGGGGDFVIAVEAGGGGDEDRGGASASNGETVGG